MKIGLISDTHTPSTGKTPPLQVAKAFAGVDLILHAGDIYTASCLDWLEGIAPVQAAEYVGSSNFTGDARVAEKHVVEAAGFAIGLVHDLMIPGLNAEVFPGTIGSRFPADRSIPLALEKVFGSRVDIVVSGHTHEAMVEEHQGVLLVNPGSPSLPKHIRKLGTVAILELNPPRRRATLVDLAGLS